MRFERGIRSSGLKPYPMGYEPEATDDFNSEAPVIQFGALKDRGVWLGDKDLPQMIALEVRIIPEWVDNTTSTAMLDQGKACTIYLPQSVYSGVNLQALGSGYYQKAPNEGSIPFVDDTILTYQLEFAKPVLYHKTFLCQADGRHIKAITPQVEQGEFPLLWAYGGQQIREDIHPIVFNLSLIREETSLQHTSLMSWRERGLLPLLPVQEGGGLQDAFEEDQTRTLKESLEAGKSIIHLSLGIDEGGTTVKVPYVSHKFFNNHIIYQKGGERIWE